MRLIIDTDIGCDCDDAGALAVAHALTDRGQCEIVAITNCTSRVDGCSAIDAINRYYGREDIAVGTYMEDGFLDSPTGNWYSKHIQKHFENRFQDKSDCDDGVKVLRRALADSPVGETVIAGIGPMRHLALFLQSEPDEISPLTGSELIAQNQCQLFIMAGCFDASVLKERNMIAEWNVEQDIAAAQIIAKEWPCEVIFSPYEVGVKLLSGKSLEPLSEDNPVRESYVQFGTWERESWDQSTVHFAVTRDENIWTLSEKGDIIIDDFGKSQFIPNALGTRSYMKIKDRKKALDVIQDLMSSPSRMKVTV